MEKGPDLRHRSAPVPIPTAANVFSEAWGRAPAISWKTWKMVRPREIRGRAAADCNYQNC